jgi:hypothetical protein
MHTLKNLFRKVKHYTEIFENRSTEPPWLEELDAILCSVGPEERVWGYRGDDLIRSGGLTREELDGLVLGDIAGILIPKPGSWNHPKLTRIRECWNGITYENLAQTARRAYDSRQGAIGVCVMALGANKARLIKELLKPSTVPGRPTHSLINQLWVDQDLARELYDPQGNKAMKEKKRPGSKE